MQVAYYEHKLTNRTITETVNGNDVGVEMLLVAHRWEGFDDQTSGVIWQVPWQPVLCRVSGSSSLCSSHNRNRSWGGQSVAGGGSVSEEEALGSGITVFT